eukprot:jgi/Orpsp1_1/1180326/evm.model.c7180000072952.1
MKEISKEITNKVIELINEKKINDVKKFVIENYNKIEFNKNLYEIALKNDQYEVLKYLCGTDSDLIYNLFIRDTLDDNFLNYIINHDEFNVTGKDII